MKICEKPIPIELREFIPGHLYKHKDFSEYFLAYWIGLPRTSDISLINVHTGISYNHNKPLHYQTRTRFIDVTEKFCIQQLEETT